MPTNEERKALAKRLRVLASHAPADADMVLDALDLYPGEYIEGFDPRCVERLADLIEPEPERTCRNVSKSTYSDEFDCSECGLNLDLIGSECGCGSTMAFFEGRKMVRELKEPNFCPNCVARVKEEA